MVIGRDQVDAIIAHARAGFPNESCGLLATQDDRVTRFYPIDNVDRSPVHYNMDSQQQLKAMLDMDEHDWVLGAIYHSHTRTKAFPSATDLSLAFYPDAVYLILSLAIPEQPDLRAFRIVDGHATEAEIEISDSGVSC